MIICKRPVHPDDHSQKADDNDNNNHNHNHNHNDNNNRGDGGGHQGDRTEGGKEGKGERGEEEGKLLRTGQTDGIEGSIKGPRETRPQVML